MGIYVYGNSVFSGAVSGVLAEREWQFDEARCSLFSGDVEVFLSPSAMSPCESYGFYCLVCVDGEYFDVFPNYACGDQMVSFV